MTNKGVLEIFFAWLDLRLPFEPIHGTPRVAHLAPPILWLDVKGQLTLSNKLVKHLWQRADKMLMSPLLICCLITAQMKDAVDETVRYSNLYIVTEAVI